MSTQKQRPILIVKSNKESGSVGRMQLYLEDLNTEVVVAHDGKQALELLKRTTPVLLIMDWELPLIKWVEFIRSVRTQARFAILPIMAITGSRETISGVLKAGATIALGKRELLRDSLSKIARLLIQAQSFSHS